MVLPQQSKDLFKNLYIKDENILTDFIESDSWHHCTPDECYGDIINGKSLDLNKYQSMNHKQRRVFMRKVKSISYKDFNKKLEERTKSFLNSHASGTYAQPKTKSKPQKHKKAVSQIKISQKK
ncbi:MAG: hypothetical protein ACRYGR_08995 [Janthinobacterium lividum]